MIYRLSSLGAPSPALHLTSIIVCPVHLVFELVDKLLITRQHVRTVLNKTAQCPQPQRWLAVLLDNIQMGIVRSPPQLTRFLDDGIDAFRELVVENLKRCLEKEIG